MSINSLSGSNQLPITDKPITKSATSQHSPSAQDTATEAYTLEINNTGPEMSVSPETPDRNTINALKQQILSNPDTAIAAQANSKPENVLSLLKSE